MMHWLKWARIFGVLLLLLILRSIDWQRILPTLASLKPWYLVVYVFCNACMAGVRVLRLHMCARKLGFPLRLADSYAATVEPIFMGAVTPGRLGELSRIAYLNRHGMPVASAFVYSILERIIDLCTLLCVAVGGVIYLFGNAAMRPYAFGVIAVLLVAFHFCLAASKLAAAYIEPLASGIIRKLTAPSGDTQEKLWAAFHEAVGSVAPLIEVLAIVCVLLNLCQIWMLSLAFGFDGSQIPICFAYTVSTIISLLPISPAGLGTREATYIYIMGAQGIGREQALLFSLLDGVALGTLAPAAMVMPLWIRSGLHRFLPANGATGLRNQRQSGPSANQAAANQTGVPFADKKQPDRPPGYVPD